MIYFLRSPSSGLIKIGRTRFLRVRLADLSYQHREPLVVLGVLDEPDVYETQLHRQFKKWRVKGEWFEPTRHLLSFIQSSTRAWTPDMGVGSGFVRRIPCLGHEVEDLGEQVPGEEVAPLGEVSDDHQRASLVGCIRMVAATSSASFNAAVSVQNRWFSGFTM